MLKLLFLKIVSQKIKKSPTYKNLSLEKTLIINSKFSEELSEPGKSIIFASTHYQKLKHFKKIYGFIVANDDILHMNHTFESRLSIDFIDIFEIQAGQQLINIRQPKKLFDT